MEIEKIKKLVWEMGTSGVENWEIVQRLERYYGVIMTEEELVKFINKNFRGKK